jgi:serine/threonine protein kinase
MGRAPFPLGVTVRIVVDVCAGLAAAHAATDAAGNALGIVHRDVSPQNVMVTFDGQVKVIDFGVAKATALASESRAGMMKGKYAYMSPEQLRGDPIDARSDIFGIGVMLWELVGWRRLFKRSADWLTMRAVVEDVVEPPSALRPEAGAELDAIVARALSRDRERRYPSVDTLASDLLDLAARQHWDTSPAALSALMHELFADRLAAQTSALKKARAATVEQLLLDSDDSAELDWVVQPHGDDSEVINMEAEEPEESRTTSAKPPVTRSAAAPRPGGRGRRLIGVLAALAVLAAGIAAGFVVMGRLRDDAPASSAARLVLRGQEGVSVALDGRKRGLTPLVLDDAPAGRPFVVTLTKSGFNARRLEVPAIAAGAERVVTVSLDPLR